MNVTVENLAPCKKLVRVEVPAAKVDETFKSVTRDYQRQAALPGFRPGKAPEHLVLRKYETEILGEVKKNLISESYRQAMKDHNIDVLGYPDVEEVQFGRGQDLQFTATVETAPEFELPDYKGLPARREARSVTEADMNRALETLRQRQTTYETVARPVQSGEIAVVNFTGTCEGKPVTELAPTAKGLTEQKNFWVELTPQSFIPGFADQLLGAQAGDRRTVTVDFGPDFVTPQLQGKQGVYEVEVVEVKEKILPALDDAFAKSYGAESFEKLCEGVRRDLENELTSTQHRNIRNQLIRSLLDRVHFELPEGAVAQETRNVVLDIVRENQQRGISRDLIEEQKEQIYSAATSGAKERVKVSFLIRKIAEKENIKVSQDEVANRITSLAAMYQIPTEKFVKDLQKRNGVVEIYDQLANEKVVAFLQEHAAIEEVPAATPAA